MSFKLPRLPSNAALTDEAGKPTITFQTWWQQVIQTIERAIALIVELTGITEQFDAAIQQAQQAAADAQAAASDANAAAADAAATAAANAREQALVNSYIDPASVLTASTTTITIAAHTRHYADGTSAAVSAGTVAASAPGDTDYVSYSDPTRAGGDVAYVATPDQPAQTGDTHVVGAVIIPASGTVSGGRGPRKPGFVSPDE